MMPYFFVAGHDNYAWSGLIYLKTMDDLPNDVLCRLLIEEDVMRHEADPWNGIWSDMFIESTFMRYVHGKADIVRITLKPETLKTWDLSRQICSQIMEDISYLREASEDKSQTAHKEESKGRIAADQKVRLTIKRKLEAWIDPLSPDAHPECSVNVVNGSLAPASVNVENALAIVKTQFINFERFFQEAIMSA